MEPTPTPTTVAKGKPITQRWLPITLLEAEGYYQGTTQLWLPKQRSPSDMKDYIQQNHSSQSSFNKHRWISRATSKKQQWHSKINRMGKTKVLSTTSTWVPKPKSKQRKKPRRRKRSKKYKSSSCWVPKNLLQTQGYYAGNSWIWLPKNILPPNPREKQVATVREQDTKKASSRWVPKSLLMAQEYCGGNSKMWIPKRVLLTSHVKSTKHEEIRVTNKGKQVIQDPTLAPIVLPIHATKSTYEQGESSCNSLEKLSQPLSIISTIPSPIGTLAPQVSHDNMMAMLPSVLPYSKTNTSNGENGIFSQSEDFDEVMQQVIQAKDFLESKIKASANWFNNWTSSALQNLLPSSNLRSIQEAM